VGAGPAKVRGDERRAALIAVGDELLNGQQLDTNSSWLSQALAEQGFEVLGFSVVGDDEVAIAERIGELAGRVELLILTGGLGPTLDDVTRHAVARAVGVDLERDDEVLEGLRRLFARRGREMAAPNERQALFPRGATVFENQAGTAPGFRIRHGAGAWLVSLPGPPRELQPMFAGALVPWLATALPRRTRVDVANFYLYGLSESDFAADVGDWMSREADPRIGVCASGRVLKVRIEGRRSAGCGSSPQFLERVAAFRARFAQAIFSETQPSVAHALAELLVHHGLTFACAESCTGGEIASRLVDVPGISAVFLEGFVTYSNAAKVARLGVAPDLLATHGAVSAEVAAAMAAGAARVSGARLALSTTGIAGPEGGSPEKPVGLVQVGLCLDGEVEVSELRLPPRGRDLIRDWAATSACELARRAVVASLGGPD
jgi:nicotinamide-nucleotide amidase